jgi:hypothetical protein
MGVGQHEPRFPLLLPLVFRLAPTHLGWDTQRQFTRRPRDPRVETLTNTLAILLLFRVIAEISITFGSSVSCGGLRIFGCSANFFDFGSSAVFALASAGRFSTSVVSAFCCSVITFGLDTLANFSLAPTRAGQSDPEAEDPSAGFDTSAVSARLGRCVKTLTFFGFGVLAIAEAAIFLFFPCFREG